MTDLADPVVPSPEETADAIEEETEAQQRLDLPDHMGAHPRTMVAKLSGSTDRIQQAHKLGERLVLLVEVDVDDAGHKRSKKAGLQYVETWKVVDAYTLDNGADLLAEHREAWLADEDNRLGRQRLPIEEAFLDEEAARIIDSERCEFVLESGKRCVRGIGHGDNDDPHQDEDLTLEPVA